MSEVNIIVKKTDTEDIDNTGTTGTIDNTDTIEKDVINSMSYNII